MARQNTESYAILLRHASAVKEEVNGENPLSDEGIVQSGCVAIEIFAALTGLKVTKVRILHSHKLRAQQTAEIIHKEFEANNISAEIALAKELKAGEAPEKMQAKLIQERLVGNGATVLVGHLPHLHKLAQILGFDALSEEDFPNASGVLFEFPYLDDTAEEWGMIKKIGD
ncbi:hypothetical protein CYMTET_25868 [Cymbomonas tetramitiformis]|uniref:Phosphohistidine phosphatase SixA n=1 Tax=Cymbomonas tetramitiformis TaxID=36881 RepID=A0AAE0FTR0_9CHLO|nr:hypothetical protein CYMTET_25868 [Cymbomonas tetramitiformis]